MLVRMFLSAIDPDDLAQVRRIFKEDVVPILEAQPGCLGVELLANIEANAGGLVDGAAVSRWASQEDLDNALAQPRVQESIARVVDLLRHEPVRKTFEVLE